MAHASSTLPPTIRQGVLNLPGATWQTQRTAERLLAEDRAMHHCYWRRVGFHNHLSHHILAAYDLGAPPALLQKIFDAEAKDAWDLYAMNRTEGGAVEPPEEEVDAENWMTFLGDGKYYPGYLEFFTREVASLSVGEALERYIFAPAANRQGTLMLPRFIGGVLHPLIQMGYAVEFGSDAMVAQALAQTAIHNPFLPELFDLTGALSPPDILTYQSTDPSHRQPSQGHSLLSILRQAYDSEIMRSAMPCDPNALLSARFRAACADRRRTAEIRRLAALWQVDATRGQAELDDKAEELLWAATLLLVGSERRGHAQRLDFFLMHMLNASLFVPSLLAAISTAASKAALLRAFVPVLLIYLTARGWPRIDADLVMSYTDTPRPPNAHPPQPDASAIGSPHDPADFNPWPGMVAAVLHAPDAHTLKAVRTLYYAAQRYGRTPPGGAIGAFGGDGRETHAGMGEVDGSVFVRAAGVVMETLGWVTHGQKAGSWWGRATPARLADSLVL